MTIKKLLSSAVLATAGVGLLWATAASAQGVVAAAIAAGDVGEQADGYLGIAGAVGADVKREVEAINIKRRAVYTDLAGKRGVTVSDAAAATGCETLATRVKTGQAYRIGAGAWQKKGAGAIPLPGYCGNAN